VNQLAVALSNFLSSCELLCSIVAEPGDFSAALALSALIHACYDTAKVAVVRYVKRQNGPPMLGILIPVVKADVEAFYFNQLPFEEDIRESVRPPSPAPRYSCHSSSLTLLYFFCSYIHVVFLLNRFSFAGLDDVKPTANQMNAAINLIRSMNLMQAGVPDDEGNPTEALVPKRTFNPALQRFYQCVEHRALDPSADISELDPAIQRYIVPDASLAAAAAPALAEFKASFDLRPVEADQKVKKRHWKDWYSSEMKESDLEEVSKRMKAQGEGIEGGAAAAAAGGGGAASPGDSRNLSSSLFSLESAVADLVDHVSALHPIESFHSMLARRDDPGIVPRAMDELVQRMRETIQQSFAGSGHEKVLAMLQALRAACVKFEEPDKFLAALQAVKKDCSPSPEKPRNQNAELLSKCKAANILPIHQGEVASSMLSQAEAEKFWSQSAGPDVAAVSAPSAPEKEADLFDSME
jgi:ATP-dependent DNA helicase 2 subunit 2